MEVINDFSNEKGFDENGRPSGSGENRADNSGSLSNKALIGLVFLIAGLLLAFRNMDLLPYYFDNLIFSWPMLLVAIGLVIALGSKDKTAGLIVVGVGAFFLLPYIFNKTFHMYKLFWPAIFIVIGAILITTRHNKKHHEFQKDTSVDDDNWVECTNIFSGTNKKVVSDSFKGGKIEAIFGGSELDLTKATLAPGRNVLEITCVFGGVTIIVPDSWHVSVEVTPILGGFSDSRKKSQMVVPDSSSQLVITGTVVFGGGELK
jgi:predicted membrane protein